MMKLWKWALLLTVMTAVLSGPQTGGSVGPFTNFVILLDQSGEMNDTYHNQSKNYLAREVAKRIINNIPTDRPMKGAIYMYGIMAADNENRVLRIQKWQAFNKDTFLLSLEKADKQTGPSSLSVALRKLRNDIQSEGITGWIAVFIISGGNHTDVETHVEDRAKELKQSHPELCIYTILVGKSQIGGKNLHEIEQKGKCGMQVNADSVDSGEEVRRYLSAIFTTGGGTADADKDGVPDDKDQCPNTPFGANVDERGCWTVHNINFDVNKWDIKPEYYLLLDEIAGVMNANPDLFITIEGHTDSDGTNESNLQLSQKRAQAVRDYLIRADVDPNRLTAVGKGEDYPIADNNTPAGKAMNRRIEFVIQKR